MSLLMLLAPRTTATDAAAYSPADEFTGGKNGWLFDGSAGKSAFLQSAGGSVAVNGDPLGSVEDLSGNGNDLLQSTGGSKPVNTVSGGINSVRVSSGKSAYSNLAVPVPAAHTVVWVTKGITAEYDFLYLIERNSGGTYNWLGQGVSGGGSVCYFYENNSGPNYVEDLSTTGLFSGVNIIVIKRFYVSSALKYEAWVYRADGSEYKHMTERAALVDQTITQCAIGFPPGTLQSTMCVSFYMGIEGDIDTTNLVAYLADAFGAWSPT